MLVDTSVWVDHLRHRNARLAVALERDEVYCHPFVIGELACGNLANRKEILALLDALPKTPFADHEEVLAFVERHELAGKGLGWVDVHLLASASLGKVALFSLDSRLARAAERMGLGVSGHPSRNIAP